MCSVVKLYGLKGGSSLCSTNKQMMSSFFSNCRPPLMCLLLHPRDTSLQLPQFRSVSTSFNLHSLSNSLFYCFFHCSILNGSTSSLFLTFSFLCSRVIGTLFYLSFFSLAFHLFILEVLFCCMWKIIMTLCLIFCSKFVCENSFFMDYYLSRLLAYQFTAEHVWEVGGVLRGHMGVTVFQLFLAFAESNALPHLLLTKLLHNP